MIGRKRVLLMTGERATSKEIVSDALNLHDDVQIHSGPVSVDFIRSEGIWAIIGDRNGHILTGDVIDAVEGRAFNSHPSLLPLQRGWQPIFFSVWENSPVGVSIHQIDVGLDTGRLIYQSEVEVTSADRLDSLHFRCRLEILKGWAQAWPLVRTGELEPWQQSGKGSYHSRKEFEDLFPRLSDGWKTSVHDVRRLAEASDN